MLTEYDVLDVLDVLVARGRELDARRDERDRGEKKTSRRLLAGGLPRGPPRVLLQVAHREELRGLRLGAALHRPTGDDDVLA